MPSLGVAEGIADIVSSLFRVGKTTESVFSCCEDIRPDVEAAETRLIETLQEGPQRINNEYIANLHSVGLTFASCDGMLASLHGAHA
jgi:hypothetical protein